MYKTLKTINDSRSILNDTRFSYKKEEEREKPVINKYIETMFFAPLDVPEQGKVLQSATSSMRR